MKKDAAQQDDGAQQQRNRVSNGDRGKLGAPLVERATLLIIQRNLVLHRARQVVCSRLQKRGCDSSRLNGHGCVSFSRCWTARRHS